MDKLKYFKFFFVYRDAFEELSGRNAKKLLLAFCDYAEKGYTSIQMNSKTKATYTALISLFNADKQRFAEYGRKGGVNSRGVSKSKKRTAGVRGGV